MRRLRAGIIGLGVGEQHIAGYQKHPHCQVVALCDFSDAKLAQARKKYPDFKITVQAEEILNDSEIDLVSIASYDNYHYEHIVKAIANDKHIFVEKPLCLEQKQARDIRARLKAKPKLKLSSNLILRMSPRFRCLKEMLEKGSLGTPFYIEGDYNYGRLHKLTHGWRGEIDFYSVVYGGGVHIVDLMLWLTGQRIIEVAAYGNRLSTQGSNFRYNDLVVCIMKFAAGLVGKMAVNFSCVFPHFHPFAVYGTKATFLNGLEYGLLFESRQPLEPPKKLEAGYPSVHKGALIHSFIDSILNGSPPGVSTEDVFNAMSVCFAIEKATQHSGPVTVEY